VSEEDLDRVAGLTGAGWTASLTGYLSTMVGYGNTLVVNPPSLRYLGGVLFVTTLGLDRLGAVLSGRER
jgi:hypothetical protein